jgi:hypothetical protein
MIASRRGEERGRRGSRVISQPEQERRETCSIDTEAIGDFKLLELLTSDRAEVNRVDSAGVGDQRLEREESWKPKKVNQDPYS